MYIVGIIVGICVIVCVLFTYYRLMIGLSDTVLLCFISYLKNRYFSIKSNNEYSSKIT